MHTGLEDQGLHRVSDRVLPSSHRHYFCKIDVKRLIINRFKFDESKVAFNLVKEGRFDVFKVMIEMSMI